MHLVPHGEENPSGSGMALAQIASETGKKQSPETTHFFSRSFLKNAIFKRPKPVYRIEN